MTDPNGGVTSYEYNCAGKLTKGISPTNDITLYSYDLNGNLVQETNANGKVTSYEYDRFSNLIKKTEPDGAQTKYQYDPNGNLTKLILPNQTDTGSIITYDAMNRKVSVTDADQNVIQNYTYSSRGNLSAIYNGSNLLCFTYEYDQDDHLIKETDYSGHAVSYLYDLLGNMTGKTDANGNSTYYFFNPDSTLKQVSFPDGGHISRQSGGSLSYYFYNAHGDVVQTANEDGTIENRYEYDIFGETTLCIEEYSNPFRYCGEYTDEETGNIYLRSRYYNPETARFLTQDSYLGQAKNPATLNRYTYCANDPINYVDPTGRLGSALVPGSIPKEEGYDTPSGSSSGKNTTYDPSYRDMTYHEPGGYDFQYNSIPTRPRREKVGAENAIWNNFGEVIGYNPNGAGYVDRSETAKLIRGGGAQAKQPIFAIDPTGKLPRSVMYNGRTGYRTLVFDWNVDQMREFNWYLSGDKVTVYSTYDLTKSEALGYEIQDKLNGTDGTGTWYTDYSYVLLADATTGDLSLLIAKEAYEGVQSGNAYTMEQTISEETLIKWMVVAGLRKCGLDPLKTYTFDGVERTLLQIITEDRPHFAAMQGARSSTYNEGVEALNEILSALGMEVPSDGIFDNWQTRGAVNAIMGGYHNRSETDSNFWDKLTDTIILYGMTDEEGGATLQGAFGNNAKFYATSLEQGQRDIEEAQRIAAAQQAAIAQQQWLASQRAANQVQQPKQYGNINFGPKSGNNNQTWAGAQFQNQMQAIGLAPSNNSAIPMIGYNANNTWLGFGTVHTYADNTGVGVPILLNVNFLDLKTTTTGYPSVFYINTGDVVNGDGRALSFQGQAGVNIGPGYIEGGLDRSVSAGYGGTGVTVSKESNFPYTKISVTYDQTVKSNGNTRVVSSTGVYIEKNDYVIVGAAVGTALIMAAPEIALGVVATAAIISIIPEEYYDNQGGSE